MARGVGVSNDAMTGKALYALYCQRSSELLAAVCAAGGWMDGPQDARIGPKWPGACHHATGNDSMRATVRSDGTIVVYCFSCQADALESLDAKLGWGAQGFPDGKPWRKGERRGYDLGPPIRYEPDEAPEPPVCAPAPPPAPVAAPKDWTTMFAFGMRPDAVLERKPEPEDAAAQLFAAAEMGADELADAIVDSIAAAEPDIAPEPEPAPPPPAPEPEPEPAPPPVVDDAPAPETAPRKRYRGVGVCEDCGAAPGKEGLYRFIEPGPGRNAQVCIPCY